MRAAPVAELPINTARRVVCMSASEPPPSSEIGRDRDPSMSKARRNGSTGLWAGVRGLRIGALMNAEVPEDHA